jgi:hypothetical protein
VAAVALYAAAAATYYRASGERLAFAFLAALPPGHDPLPAGSGRDLAFWSGEQ